MSRTKGPSKAQTILNEAKERMNSAFEEVRNCRLAYELAQATLKAHTESFHALEQSLTSKPRDNGAGKSQSPAPSVGKKSRSKKSNQLEPTVSIVTDPAAALFAGDKDDAIEGR